MSRDQQDHLFDRHDRVTQHTLPTRRANLERYYRPHRSALLGLLEVLEPEPTSADHGVGDAVAVLRANRHRVGEQLPDHHEGNPIDVSFAGELCRSTPRGGHRLSRNVDLVIDAGRPMTKRRAGKERRAPALALAAAIRRAAATRQRSPSVGSQSGGRRGGGELTDRTGS